MYLTKLLFRAKVKYEKFVDLKALYSCQSLCFCLLPTGPSLRKKGQLVSVLHYLRRNQKINKTFFKHWLEMKKKKIQ